MQQQEEQDLGEMQEQQQPEATLIADTPQIAQRPHECGVCLVFYDELERRPRTLPCGHTYCTMCLSVLLQDGHLTCPSCRTDHFALEINLFPISYAFEALIKMMKAQQGEITSQAAGEVPQVTLEGSQATEVKTKRRAAVGLSRKLRAMIQEQGVSIESLGTTAKKELEQLKQYQAKLGESKAKHANLLKELDKLVQQHRSIVDLLQEENVRVEGFVEEGEEIQRELKAGRGQLDQVNTAQEAFTTIDATDHAIVEVEEWLQHSREEIPNGAVLSTSITMLEATKTALEDITEETKATPDWVTSGHPDCSIMEAVGSSEGGPVELVDLCTKKLRKKLEDGRVFATQKYEDGTCYSSKVVISEEKKLHLHTLKNESPPPTSFILQVSKALKDIDYLSISVFLDLAWLTEAPQRVYIKLKADTPLTRQFVTLCMGHTGLTYCNTNLLREDNDNDYKLVWGGDISGQKAASNQVLPPIQVNQCDTVGRVTKGMVVANIAFNTQFGIGIGNKKNCYQNLTYYYLGYLGSDGQSVVETAVRHGITNVRVVNCGVVC